MHGQQVKETERTRREKEDARRLRDMESTSTEQLRDEREEGKGLQLTNAEGDRDTADNIQTDRTTTTTTTGQKRANTGSWTLHKHSDREPHPMRHINTTDTIHRTSCCCTIRCAVPTR